MRRNENVFADYLKSRPFLEKFCGLVFVLADRRIVAGEADVIAQRIEPDVVHIIAIERQLDAPTQSRFRARDAEIAGKSFDGVAQFRFTKVRNDKWLFGSRSFVDQIEQPLFMALEFKIVIFFLAKLDLTPFWSEFAIGAAFFIR